MTVWWLVDLALLPRKISLVGLAIKVCCSSRIMFLRSRLTPPHPCRLQLVLLAVPLRIPPPGFVQRFLRFSLVAARDYYPVQVVWEAEKKEYEEGPFVIGAAGRQHAGCRTARRQRLAGCQLHRVAAPHTTCWTFLPYARPWWAHWGATCPLSGRLMATRLLSLLPRSLPLGYEPHGVLPQGIVTFNQYSAALPAGLRNVRILASSAAFWEPIMRCAGGRRAPAAAAASCVRALLEAPC